MDYAPYAGPCISVRLDSMHFSCYDLIISEVVINEIYRTSFKLVCAEPLSRGLGALGPGFHPIFHQLTPSPQVMIEETETNHEDNLECSWYTSIFLSIHFYVLASTLSLSSYPLFPTQPSALFLCRRVFHQLATSHFLSFTLTSTLLADARRGTHLYKSPQQPIKHPY